MCSPQQSLARSGTTFGHPLIGALHAPLHKLIVNGVRRDIALTDACVTLLDLSRERLHPTGTRTGCHRGPMRRLHHFRRWPADQFLPRFGGASRWREITPIEGAAQPVGDMIWGASFALHEEAVVDRRSGRVMNADLAEYHVPVNANAIDGRADRRGPDLHVNALGIKAPVR